MKPIGSNRVRKSMKVKGSRTLSSLPLLFALGLAIAQIPLCDGQDTNPTSAQAREPVAQANGSVQSAANAAAPDSATADKPSTSIDPAMSPEIARRFEVLNERIDQLERELKAAHEGAPSVAVQPTSTESVSDAAQQPPAVSKAVPATTSEPTEPTVPFAYADWTWLNGTPRNKDAVWDSKFFTPEIRFDSNFISSLNHPKDDTLGGSTEIFRSNEFQVEQISFGGDFHWQNVRGRVLTLGGMFGVTTPRNDASAGRGQWDLRGAYKYFGEAYGGYHFNVNHGLNVDAGIFVSYIGLFSYYNFDNWAYQPSFVSSNTPWFFTGERIQIFPTAKLKIEPWIINGWQSYGRYNGRLGVGGQILYRPTGSIEIISNNYGAGADALGIPTRTRYHTDNSLEVKYYDHPERYLDKMAFSLTGDLGCEEGGGVACTGDRKNAQGQIIDYKQAFLGFMLYNRWWFHKDRYGFTLGGGKINNPGRYLVLLPPINGATATSGTPYFTENPGDQFKAWDMSATYDYMPSQYITFRWEFNHRHSNVPYWSGPGGITPTVSGNVGAPGSFVPGWAPDLRYTEDRATMAILVKF